MAEPETIRAVDELRREVERLREAVERRTRWLLVLVVLLLVLVVVGLVGPFVLDVLDYFFYGPLEEDLGPLAARARS